MANGRELRKCVCVFVGERAREGERDKKEIQEV